MQDVSIWVWMGALCAVLLAVLLGAVWWGTRPGRDDRVSPIPRDRSRPTVPVWHVVEEYVPASRDQPGRWVEMRRTHSRDEAEREWERLRREEPEQQDSVRIVTTTAAPVPRRAQAPPPTPAPRPAPAAPRPAAASPNPSAERLSFVAAPDTAPLYDRLVRFARTDGVFGMVTERLYLRILGQRPDPTLGPEDRVEYARNHGDAALVPIFAGMLRQDGGRERLEKHMTHFLMGALGGPKRYTGRGMATAHSGLGITDAEFDRVIGHVVAVLQDLDVPADWIGEVGDTVAPLREAIVVTPAHA